MRKLGTLMSLLLLAGLTLFTACKQEVPYESFSLDDSLHMEVNNSTCFTYNWQNCQMMCSRDTRTFRAGTDSMSEYYEVSLRNIPGEVGQNVVGNVYWTSETMIVNKKNITLETVRIEGDKIWLWNSQFKIGVVVRFFD